MKQIKVLHLTAALASVLSLNLPAQTLLTSGHTDVGIAFESGAFDLHIGQHEATPPMEYEPGEAILAVDSAHAQSVVPSGVAWSFLGASGSSVWILPQVENPSLIFLGLGTEELDAGLFVNDQVTLSLTAVRAPGAFSMYEVGVFGTPTVFMNSGDGVSGGDQIVLSAGGHRHVNWAFTTPGVYEVDFEASGILAEGNQSISSGPVTYTFSVGVVPEPSSFSIILLAAAGWLGMNRRRS
jgi:surface-anchored protein